MSFEFQVAGFTFSPKRTSCLAGSMPARRAVMLIAMVGAVLLGAGCASYKLRGKAIEGTTPGVFVVEKSDERLQQGGVPGAVVSLTVDPGRLNAEHAGSDISDIEGDFAVPVDQFGAGVLEYQVRLDARLEDHRSVNKQMKLPGSDKRVLIVLAPGNDSTRPKPEGFLEETMRMGEPYMDQQ